jgi:hypothetical protein
VVRVVKSFADLRQRDFLWTGCCHMDRITVDDTINFPSFN